MNTVTRYLFAVVCILFGGPLVSLTCAQGSLSDYQRADHLRELFRGKVFKTSVEPHWFADNTKFWYRNQLSEGRREFIVVHAAEGKRCPAFDHAKLAAALSKIAGKEAAADRLPIDFIQIGSQQTIRFNAHGKGWNFDKASGELSEAEPVKPSARRPSPERRRRGGRHRGYRGADSPDGKWTASIKNHNLFVKQKDNDKDFALTTDGSDEHAYGSQFAWSPDSKKLVVMRRRKGQEHLVYRIESSPKDQVQPKLHSRNYIKPGDRIAQSKPHLFDVTSLKEIPIDNRLFSNPWSIDELRWDQESQRFTFLYNQRGHGVLRIVGVDGQTGEAGTLIDESSKTFVDYAGKKYSRYLDRTHEIIWMSERDGWNHLYLFDDRTGQLKNQITQGEWVVRGVDRVDEEKRQIWFRASGLFPEQDPYYIHYCRVDFDGKNLVHLTRGNGTHRVEFSPDGKCLIDTYSRVDMPGVTELRATGDGRRLCELERSDLSSLTATGWKKPERFVAKGRDGKTDIYGVIFRPTNFDPRTKYPVIEKIYAGPHGSFVPKRFSTLHGGQTMAELGFIVVQIDGMGTSNRSKAFHDVCWKNLGDSGFPDRILWIKAAAKRYPQLDISRVGIYGGSAGGQSSTRAMLAHGDFYKAAVSDCGCHDNRMDKIWWNELWMSWPVGPHYAEQSNVTNAHKLQGKLMLVVGEMDTNVDPASTLQVVNALIKADKDFDFLLVPGGGHGIAESRYGSRRRRDFFVRHLLGVEPRHSKESK